MTYLFIYVSSPYLFKTENAFIGLTKCNNCNNIFTNFKNRENPFKNFEVQLHDIPISKSTVSLTKQNYSLRNITCTSFVLIRPQIH